VHGNALAPQALTYAEKACVDRRLEHAIHHRRCLVYGFGVAQDWSFERAMALQGCEVHMFDPTVSHLRHPDRLVGQNLTFHRIGLQQDGKSEAVKLFNRSYGRSVYGAAVGEMLSLGAIRARLGHSHRKLSVFKVDCEGCEWEVLAGLTAHEWGTIDQLVVELHLSRAYRFESGQMALLAAQVLGGMRRAGFANWYSELNVAQTSPRSFWPPLIKEGGLDPRLGCCRQQGWIRASGAT
jgi:hypothetical protein